MPEQIGYPAILIYGARRDSYDRLEPGNLGYLWQGEKKEFAVIGGTVREINGRRFMKVSALAGLELQFGGKPIVPERPIDVTDIFFLVDIRPFLRRPQDAREIGLTMRDTRAIGKRIDVIVNRDALKVTSVNMSSVETPGESGIRARYEDESQEIPLW